MGSMEHVSFDGQWWLPEKPQRRIPGTLSLDADNGLMLLLHGDLWETIFSESGSSDDVTTRTAAVVHGIRHDDQKYITLFEVSGTYWPMPSDYARTVYGVGLGLVNARLTEDLFARLDVEFDYLSAWTQPPSRSDRDQSNPDVIRISTGNRELGKTELASGARLSLYSGVVGSWSGSETNVREYCAFALEPVEQCAGRDLIAWVVRPLQNLLAVALGRPVRLTEVRLSTAEEATQRTVAETLFYHEQQVAAEPPLDRSDFARNVLNYDTPTLLTAQHLVGEPLPISVGEVLGRWFEESDKLVDALVQLLGPLNAPFMSAEHRYSSTFLSAETLHDRLGYTTTDLPIAAHRLRTARVLDALDSAGLSESDLTWAGSIIASRNDKSLQAKLDTLLNEAGAAGAALRQAAPSFASEAGKLRGGVAHPSSSDDAVRRRRFVFEHAIRWLIRGLIISRLLGETELSHYWERLANKNEFKRVVKALEATARAESGAVG